MINERTTELINASLDGELSERHQEELEAALLESEAAVQYKQELQALEQLIADIEPLEVPAILHRRTVDQIQLPKRGWSWLSLAEVPAFVRYGMTAAAGLLITVGLYEFRPGAINPSEMDSMVGTIMRDTKSVESITLDSFSFELNDLTSSVSLLQREDALVLDVTLDTTELVEITMDFTSEGLQFDAIAQMQSDLTSIEVADQAVQVKGSGKQHFAVLLHHEDLQSATEEARIGLRFLSNGELIQEGVLVKQKP